MSQLKRLPTEVSDLSCVATPYFRAVSQIIRIWYSERLWMVLRYHRSFRWCMIASLFCTIRYLRTYVRSYVSLVNSYSIATFRDAYTYRYFNEAKCNNYTLTPSINTSWSSYFSESIRLFKSVSYITSLFHATKDLTTRDYILLHYLTATLKNWLNFI